MKKEIAKTKMYEMYVDTAKNRTHIIFRGFWERLDDVSNLLEDFRRVMAEVKSGFTSITDLSDMKPPSQETSQLLVEIKNIADKKGQGRVARVVDKKLIKIVSQRISRESEMGTEVEHFATYKEAEAWLDSFKD
ncbi:MAG: STAS/SEC14 domain-containing protein [Deltaproteobacteria bacterium]|uniref:STAS/SEC14 domain-containing protein n=1 Tax=Candidatus Zymogenus saltonus TaxID=2844893 RepID=A0A9D8PNM1_9DELT|nr:STAS/SEC14 domain-containing protein [Candidatus Zymogenus saltonus]